ncbi:hypothetical protein [Glutamicibacter ardleyensis]|uniref:hypothetical protein n=1 Tax=Glutamicibacter ardleyensis TaxID=225894 RepID=UPI003FD084F5
MRKQDLDTATHAVSKYADVDEFLNSNSTPDGLITISSGAQPIDVLSINAGSDTTIVCFHGAAEREIRLPWHIGQGVTGSTGMNRIFLSDPTLYKTADLGLSWYAGSQETPRLQEILAAVVEKIVGSTGATNLIFFGSSGGGFASLEMSHRFPGSLALTMNPQTSLAKYFPTAVNRYLEHGWNGEHQSLDELPESVNHDLTKVYGKGFSNHVAIIQNARDWFHIGNHQLPFLNVAGLSPNVYMLMDRWGPDTGDGHTPAPKEILAPILDVLASCSGAWGDVLPGVGFQMATTDADVRARVSATANLD